MDGPNFLADVETGVLTGWLAQPALTQSRASTLLILMYFTVSWRQHDICGCLSLRPAGWRVTIATRCVHASTISDPTSPMFDLHWSIGPQPQDRRQALHQRTLAHQRSFGTPCGIREWVPDPATDSGSGTVMPRAQDPYPESPFQRPLFGIRPGRPRMLIRAARSRIKYPIFTSQFSA